MEGQARLKEQTLIVVIILFHVVGLVGFLIPKYQPLFLYLVPYHLALMTIVLLYAYGRTSARMVGFFVLIYVLGYSAEWIGVHKNWLFGDYHYGPVLGKQISRVPLLIGINWFLLIFSTGSLFQKLVFSNVWLRVFAGATLVTLLDVLIEPVAMRFNYWDWANDQIPFKNYLCWYLLAVLMLWLFEVFKFKKLGNTGSVFIISQFVFFGVLYLV